MADSSALDTRVEIVTPENIRFHYHVAGPFRRLPAYLIDFLLRAAILIGLAFLASLTFGSFGAEGVVLAILIVSWFLLSWFYGGLFEALANGQTPGKRAMHLRVLTIEGEPIAAWQAILRNILRAVDMMPVVAFPGLSDAPVLPLYLFGFFSCLATKRFQRLGDLACGTMVVVEQRDALKGVTLLRDRAVIELAERLDPSIVIPGSVARVLSSYVERRNKFAPVRREEMARILGQALQEHYGLPPAASYDLLLCAFYYRAFLADRDRDKEDELATARQAAHPGLEAKTTDRLAAVAGASEEVGP